MMQPCGEQEECLWAGQNIDAGTVTISNDANNLYVTVYSKEGFQKTPDYLKIDVVTDLPDRRPPAGQFPFKTTEINYGKEVTYQIPYSELTDLFEDPEGECKPHQLKVLVHVDVLVKVLEDDGQEIIKGETAWGGCNPGPQKTNPNDKEIGSWWFYSDYYTQCCVCWCGFSNDYQNPEDGSCLSMMYNGTKYVFWSNSFSFDEMKGEEYTISLLANPSLCVPQNPDGSFVEDERTATEVGKVVLKVYEGDDGKPYF